MSIRPRDFSYFQVFGELSDFLEIRYENNAQGDPIYIGYNKTANAGEDELTWFIVQLNYDGNDDLEYQRLPLNGVGFKYSWTDRADYFP
jgi:hypothetical protein